MGRTVYFTTPLYYVNAEPHIGHLYTTVLADLLKRYHRLVGDDVYFLTGTDEHGEKIAETAAGRGKSPGELADEVAGLFQSTWKQIGLEFDDFIRTTADRHKRYVQKVLQQVYDKGDIYFDEYTGLYCVGCERYLTESELVDGNCPDHQVPPKEVKEANYFFRMGNYQEQLIDHIVKNPGWIRPVRYRNEVLSFLKQPLEDLCISRPKTRLTWGIDLPFDNKFVTYVWFDALLNYVSAIKETAGGEDVYDRYWRECNHLIAKDILKTHAIYWPTMLISAQIPLYKQIDVHGYWLSGDSKMSKSLGNVVRPLSFDRQFGIENLRYFFFREMKFGTDAGFTYELFVERYNADLANGLGNLLSRLAALVKRNLEGRVPEPPAAAEPALVEQAVKVAAGYPEQFEQRRFHEAIGAILSLFGATDVYINEREPWKLAKQAGKERELADVLYTGLEVVRIAAVLFYPVMPGKSREILAYLGEDRPLDGSVPYEDLTAWGGLVAGHVIGDVPRVFPRIDDKKLKQVMEDAARAAPAAEPAVAVEPVGEEITIDDFAKVDLRVGVVREAGLVDGAVKLIRLAVDIGEEAPRQVFAGIRSAYPEPAKLVGTHVVMVANLKPRQMKFGLSEGMVLAGHSSDYARMCTATFDRELKPGDKVT
jgi:methionyl-tRNA synthetase